MLALLGWNPGTEQEIFSMEELVSAFSFERVHKAGARFDPDKARWYNEQYLRKQDDQQLGERFAAFLASQKDVPVHKSRVDFATGAVKLLKERVQFEQDFYATGAHLFEQPVSYEQKVIDKRLNDTTRAFIEQLPDVFDALADFSAENSRAAFESSAHEMGLKPGDVLQLFRVCISGVGSGVDLFGMVALLGKQEVNERIRTALAAM
jgi:glutamyl-tRNA synthetase